MIFYFKRDFMKYTQENIHSKKIKTALKNILLPLMAAAAVSAAAFYSADLTEPVQPLAQGTAVPENIIVSPSIRQV